MGIRRRNRPVSAAVASGPLTPDAGSPDARSARPCARDPPLPVFREYQSYQRTANVRWLTRQGKIPRAHGQKRGEAMQQHRLTQPPDSRS